MEHGGSHGRQIGGVDGKYFLEYIIRGELQRKVGILQAKKEGKFGEDKNTLEGRKFETGCMHLSLCCAECFCIVKNLHNTYK